MRCKVCEISFNIGGIKLDTTKEIAIEMMVCGTCQRKIRANNPNYGKRANKPVTKCIICGKETYHTNTHQTCGAGSCRALWYRYENEKKQINLAIQKNDFSTIGYLKLSSITKLGFSINVIKNE